MYRLDHLNGPLRGRHRIVHHRRIEIGSDWSCDIWVPEGIAPILAELEDDGTRVVARARAAVPIRVNGRETLEAELREGDRIQVGPLALRFSRRRFHVADVARWLPVAAVPLLVFGSAIAWGIRWRAEWKARRAVPPPSWVPRPTPEVDPNLKAMENVAQQLEMPAAAKQIEHLSDHLELERLILESRPLPVAEGPEEPLSRAEQMAREARQLEARGRLREAMAIWKKIFEMGPMEPLYPTAASEMFRLGRIEAERQNHSAAPPQPQPSRSPPRANPPSTQQLQRQLRIVSVDHRRFPMTGELEEMRVLEIVIAPETPAAARAVEDARVMVTFYDSVVGGAVAVPARAQREPIVIPLSSAQRDAEGRWVVRATYAVPRGFRERDRRITGREYQFHGYLVQVYRGSQLEAVEARPRTLVERKPASR